MRTALLALSSPPAFLETPGETTIPFNSWIRMFDNYMTAFSEEDIAEKSFAYSLLGYRGTEDFVYTHSGC